MEPLGLALAAIGVPLAVLPALNLAFALPKLLVLQFSVAVLVIVVLIRGRSAADTSGGGAGSRYRAVAWGLIGAWLAWQLAAAVASISAKRSWGGTYEWRNGVGTTALQVALALVVAQLARRAPIAEYVRRALVLGSIPVVAYALLQAARLDPVGWDTDFRPIFATFGNSPLLAGYLALAAPLTVARLAATRGRARRLVGMLIAGQVLVVVVSGARGGLLALLAGVGLVAGLPWLLRHSWGQSAFRTASALTGAAFCAAPLLLGLTRPDSARVLSNLDATAFPPRETVAPRLEVWRVAVEVSLEKPWLGYGPATFDLAVYSSAAAGDSDVLQSQYWDRAHNLPLELAIESGWPAAVLFISAVVAALWRSAAAAGTESSSSRMMRVFAPAAGLAAGLIDRGFNPGSVGTDVVLWLLLGVALSGGARTVGRTRWLLKRAALAGALVLAVTGVFTTLRAMSADASYLTGQLAERAGRLDVAAEQYSRAVLRDPGQVEYVRSLAGAHLALAEREFDAGMRAQAATIAQGALALEPLDVRAQELLARAAEPSS